MHLMESLSLPTVLEETLLDCLERLDLTEFQVLVEEVSELRDNLNSTDAMLTVFAPENEALEGITINDEEAIKAHVAERVIRNNRFFSGAILDTLAEGRFLHVSEVLRRDPYRWWRFSEVSILGRRV